MDGLTSKHQLHHACNNDKPPTRRGSDNAAASGRLPASLLCNQLGQAAAIISDNRPCDNRQQTTEKPYDTTRRNTFVRIPVFVRRFPFTWRATPALTKIASRTPPSLRCEAGRIGLPGRYHRSARGSTNARRRLCPGHCPPPLKRRASFIPRRGRQKRPLSLHAAIVPRFTAARHSETTPQCRFACLPAAPPSCSEHLTTTLIAANGRFLLPFCNTTTSNRDLLRPQTSAGQTHPHSPSDRFTPSRDTPSRATAAPIYLRLIPPPALLVSATRGRYYTSYLRYIHRHGLLR